MGHFSLTQVTDDTYIELNIVELITDHIKSMALGSSAKDKSFLLFFIVINCQMINVFRQLNMLLELGHKCPNN